VTKQAGVDDKLGYYGFGGVWLDYDDDGRLDLLVVNDSTPNYLYRNLGGGKFEEVGYKSGAAVNEDGREQAGMGVAVGDYDNDGRVDLFVTNFSDDTNTLRHNDGNGVFTDVTRASGHGPSSYDYMGWGVGFADFDNDGWLDAFVANGQLYPESDEHKWPMGFLQRKLLFRNRGDGAFEEIGKQVGGALTIAKSSRGAAFGDIDNDGDVDAVVNNMDDAPAVIRNDGGDKSGHWLTVNRTGDVKATSPRDAIGAKIFVTAGGKRQRRDVMSGGSYCSHSDLRRHTGATVTAVVRNGNMEINPDPEFRLEADDILVLIGRPDQISPAVEYVREGKAVARATGKLQLMKIDRPPPTPPTNDAK